MHARLAQGFAVAESLDGTGLTVAAHEVGGLLWRAGVVTGAAQLAALRPPPSDAAKRIGFDQVLRLAALVAGDPALAVPAPLPSSLAGAPATAAAAAVSGTARPLQLTVQRVVLSSSVVELQEVQSLFVVVRGELASAAHGRPPPTLRSATQRKLGATLELNLSTLLVGSVVDVELWHEPQAAGAARLLGSAQLKLGNLYQSTNPNLPLQYELPLHDSRAVHLATLHLLSQPHAAPSRPTAAVPAAGASATITAQHRAVGTGTGTGGSLQHGAAARLPGSGAPPRKPTELANWRKGELDSLETSLARLKRHTGMQVAQVMPGLEQAKLQMARMVADEAAERAAKRPAIEMGRSRELGVQLA